MTIKFTLEGKVNKKRLLQDLTELVGEKPVYMGPPSFSYKIGEYVLNREGELEGGKAEASKTEYIMELLVERGYEADTDEEFEGLSISFPRKKLSDAGIDRLRKILEAKGNLIKKALAVDELPIEISDDKVSFPWFPGVPSSEETEAYSQFIAALCKFAEKQKRVTCGERDVENEKYAFRCFLLRLGMIGDDTKPTRKILMSRLEGSASFKSGKKKDAGEESAEGTPAKNEALVADTEAGAEGGEENE